MSRRPPRLPDSNENVLKYLQDHAQYVEIQLRQRTPDTETRNSLLLFSPDGSAWELKVNNAGALTTTKVYGA